jgi:putative CocE/NonD family hydrolase
VVQRVVDNRARARHAEPQDCGGQQCGRRGQGSAAYAISALQVLPLTQYPLYNSHFDPGSPSGTAELAPYFLDWLAHPLYDDYWKPWSIEENYQNIQVPALHVAAWYDIFLGGSLRNYMGLHAHAGNEEARKGQHLMVIIGGHSGNGRTVGQVDFGPNAPFDENTLILDFYDYLFLGKQNEFANGKPVKIFVMGKNEWRFEDAWPLQRAKETRYLLESNGKANSTSGDGTLVTAAEVRQAADTYVYDPGDPVPTVGGPLCCDGNHLAAGPRDQKDVEARSDVLVYSTPPLEQDLEVTGPIMLDLFAKSSSVDTDFTGKLVDVWPDGRAINLTEGILRARFRESTSKADLIELGKVYEYKIDLWATSNVFLKGHRIRLEVSSSNFPRFDRNLNTGKSAAATSEFVKATNTVLHDKEHPSALILPVIPQ